MDTVVAKKLKQNEITFKKVNEGIKKIEKNSLTPTAQKNNQIDFVCECSDENCFEKIRLTVVEFESFRRNQNQFIIKENHQTPEIEQEIGGSKDFVIVEKTI